MLHFDELHVLEHGLGASSQVTSLASRLYEWLPSSRWLSVLYASSTLTPIVLSEEFVSFFSMDRAFRRTTVTLDQPNHCIYNGAKAMALRNISAVIPMYARYQSPAYTLLLQDAATLQSWTLGFTAEVDFTRWLDDLTRVLTETGCDACTVRPLIELIAPSETLLVVRYARCETEGSHGGILRVRVKKKGLRLPR
ncbi:hypothetical protein SDRG_08746 [Saprolegnia diclina VS20]|uniref:Uncharacterized protein n=1 Tax=Saprolegnia diclina (strain VS20) TaxID=1156394 RepID=T0RTK2_SAPDV|nr:hypothetical protein SDRG_08746 [Saprolegnia diclina VS20]EQC33642.1 hypothetical protein SDRG_08746 [Saprolegnia diclina VS20]|eukprot:XP_008612865.1 hypothetical protein SDRG_08746 [Saprolegnia diclina VS20]